MLTRKAFIKLMAAGGASSYLATRARFLNISRAAQSPQMPLNAKNIPQFIDPVPNLLDSAHRIVDDGITPITLEMREYAANILPANTVPGYAGTYVWSYLKPGQDGRASYIGPVIIAQRNQPTEIKFINLLGHTDNTQVDAYRYSTDQTLHWADPDGNMYAHEAGVPTFGSDRAQNYDGFIPAVPHLHGGYVPPVIDGGPDAWFTSDGAAVGTSFYSRDGGGPQKYCIYRYPNDQEGALIWFHDHTLGATRLNVYCGLAGAYLITGSNEQIVDNLPPLTPLVIQDRMFDTSGQLFFPSDSTGGVLWTTNPEHPYWVPEFVGDVIVVNGKSWPFMNIDQKRYTFMFINGSNARTYEMFFVDPVSKNMGPALWVIATDGGYLDTPVKLDPLAAANNRLAIMPGERYWAIVDFNGYGAGTIGPNGAPYSGTWLLKNTAKTPYPGGASPQGATTARVMQFRVGNPVEDDSYDPATGAPLRTPMIRLSNATVNQTRMLTLNEVMGMPKTEVDPVTGALTAYPGGPLEILVNNTKWSGKRITGVDTDGKFTFEARSDFTLDQKEVNYLSEIPKEGDTELWQIVNLTADAHPIHTHLAQFQLVSRQKYNTNKYTKAYAAAFTGGYDFTMDMQLGQGVFIPAYGPPLDYNTGNPNALGGNPDVIPYLQGPVMGPLPQENGWKDTVMVLPGQVTTFLIRWAPQNIPADTPSADCHLSFDPRADGGGYVWHCHIIDHEDNEMMRPDEIEPNTTEAERSYKFGIDY
jgi:spore coat protein A